MQAHAAATAESKIEYVASAAWMLMGLALVVLSGWALHVSSLTNIVPGWATMKPNTAAAFFLSGLALLRHDHRDSRLYSAVVLLIGTVTLVEYLFRSDLGIDQLLFRDPYSMIDPGRMSQITSVGFVALGAGMALTEFRSEKVRRIARGLALAAGVVGTVALLGYSYDTQALYRVHPYTSVSLETGIAFVIAAIGVHCAMPGEGLVRQIRADNAGGAMLRQLLPAALLIPYLLGLAAWMAHLHLGWEMGFSLALIVAATMLCLATITLFNANRLAREDTARRRFFSLADHSPEFIGMCDMNFKPFYVNPAGRKLVGLDSLEQTCTTPVHEFFFPEERRFIYEEFFPLVLREGRAEVEIRFRHFKTGSALWMIYNVFQITDDVGQPIGLATVSRDITARKEAEEKLRESDATTRALLETAAQAVLAVDPDGTIVLANRMAGEMFGYDSNELTGQPLELLLPERVRKKHAAHRADFASNPIPRPMGMGWALQGLRKDGSEFPVEVSLSTVQTRRGRLAVSFVSDITARRDAEDRLRNSEQQLRVLTGNLLTAQEDERRRLSRELHDDVTQRLAFLSIELSRLGEQLPDSPAETRATVRTLQEQTLRASAEVRRLARGLHPSVIEDFGLGIALEEFCEEFRQAQEVTVRFEGLVDDSNLDNACATCLYRIAQESLRNAVIHGHATDVCVTLSREPKAMKLRVKDNGAGFHTEGARTKRGLGVVSMQERIRLVNGILTISSQPGQGTEIIASVPLV